MTTGPFVLYVDDDEANRTSFEYVFEGSISFALAADGLEALERMETSPPAVLLADYRMPGMTGVELCEIVRKKHPSVQRMILTAYADLDAVIEAINRGSVHRYLQKPYVKEELLYWLNDGLRVWADRQRLADLERQVLEEAPGRVASLARMRIWHELKNLVQPLHTHLQLLEEELPQADSEVKALLEDLRRISRNLTGFADRLKSRPPLETCEGADIVETVARLFQRDHRKPAVRVLIEARPSIPMGAVPLTQVLYNLLRNAERFEAENVSIKVWADSGQSYIEVHDDGPGVEPEKVANIFTEQFTTHEQGHGFGLSTSRDLVRQGDGELTLEESKTGACFRMTFRLL